MEQEKSLIEIIQGYLDSDNVKLPVFSSNALQALLESLQQTRYRGKFRSFNRIGSNSRGGADEFVGN